MADEKEYAVVGGFIQFDPREREVAGKTVQDITVRAMGTQKKVNITIWPEHDITLEKGQLVVAEGPFTVKNGQKQDGTPATYLNLSCNILVVFEPVARIERDRAEVVNTPASGEPSPF